MINHRQWTIRLRASFFFNFFYILVQLCWLQGQRGNLFHQSIWIKLRHTQKRGEAITQLERLMLMNLQFNLCRSRNYLACGTTSHKWAVRYQLRERELMNVRLDFYGHLCCENNQTSERGVLEWQRVINKTSNDWIWMANENPAATSASKVTLCAFIESSHICHWRRNPCPVHLPGSFTATARFCFFFGCF